MTTKKARASALGLLVGGALTAWALAPGDAFGCELDCGPTGPNISAPLNGTGTHGPAWRYLSELGICGPGTADGKLCAYADEADQALPVPPDNPTGDPGSVAVPALPTTAADALDPTLAPAGVEVGGLPAGFFATAPVDEPTLIYFGEPAVVSQIQSGALPLNVAIAERQPITTCLIMLKVTGKTVTIGGLRRRSFAYNVQQGCNGPVPQAVQARLVGANSDNEFDAAPRDPATGLRDVPLTKSAKGASNIVTPGSYRIKGNARIHVPRQASVGQAAPYSQQDPSRSDCDTEFNGAYKDLVCVVRTEPFS